MSWECTSVRVKKRVQRVASMPAEVERRRERCRMKSDEREEVDRIVGLMRARRSRKVEDMLLAVRECSAVAIRSRAN